MVKVELFEEESYVNIKTSDFYKRKVNRGTFDSDNLNLSVKRIGRIASAIQSTILNEEKKKKKKF